MKSPSHSSLEEQCKNLGLRMTEQRRVIARLLSSSHDHPDVDELHRRAYKIDPKIALSTVYRTLKLWAEKGLIDSQNFGDGRARFELAPDKHHDHLINMNTGDVIEFYSPEIERLQAEICARHGYKLMNHRLELYCVPLSGEKQ